MRNAVTPLAAARNYEPDGDWSIDQYRLVMDSIDEGIVLFDLSGRIVAANKAAQAIVGVPFDEMLGRTYGVSSPYRMTREDGTDVGPQDVCVARVLRDGRPEVDEMLRLPDRGGASWVRIDARPVGGSEAMTGRFRAAGVVCVITDISERVDIERALRSSESAYRLLAQNATDMIAKRRQDGTFVYVSPAVESILGYTPDELIGTVALDLLDPEEKAGVVKAHVEDFDVAGPTTSVARFRHKAGHYVWLESTMVAVRDPKTGAVIEMQTSSRDVSARVAADAALRDSEQRWRVAFDQAPVGVALAGPDARLQVVNARLADMLGFAADELIGMTLLELTHPDDLDATLAANSRLRSGLVETYELEKRYLTRSGETVWARIRTSVLRASGGEQTQAMVLVENITEARSARDLLEHRSLHDAVTDLPNRLLLTDRLEQALRRSRATGRVGLLYCDLDRFKTVNASVGHDRGDDVLREVAARFTAAIHCTDTLARVSGDEFVIICEDVGSEQELGELADAVASSLRVPMSVGGKPYTISVSIGATLADPGLPADQILDDAESALLVAKRTGRSRRQMFDASQRDRSVDRLSIESELHVAIAEGQLRLHYQPIVEITGRRIVGYEALVRWEHPTRGLLGPAEFLPIAEDSALMGPIGAWVLDTATSAAATWAAQPDGELPWVSVNVSAQQLGRPEMVTSVESALHASGLPASRLKLEVTETALFAGADAAKQDLERLSALGVSMALDDFGTGYSSLTLLREIPVSVLKLDRSFVAQLGEDAGSTAIVQAVIALGDMLGLSTVAEGVETIRQAELLKSFGCALAQGYLFGRPAPLS
jgi:diguanylate cyclase (GGDEF)-like protein/PAS domain S-box-containing protein